MFTFAHIKMPAVHSGPCSCCCTLTLLDERNESLLISFNKNGQKFEDSSCLAEFAPSLAFFYLKSLSIVKLLLNDLFSWARLEIERDFNGIVKYREILLQYLP